MLLTDLFRNVGAWLENQGAEADVVVSSRIRLARNIAGHRFMSRASEEERRELAEKLTSVVEEALPGDDHTVFDLEKLAPCDRQALMERHLISREHSEAEGARCVVIGAGETLSVMVNEEDHLRIQAMSGGFDVDEAWARLDALDDAVEQSVPYAFDGRYGYLTACPTNVGTGLRVSVMLHLPALSMTRELQRVFAAAAKIDFIVRGLYGEGTQGQGDFYQVSNQKTLGRTEKEILDSLKVVVPQIVRYERKVRDTLFREHRAQVEDRIWRARGILANARMVSSDEALHLLSQLRLGINMGLIEDVEIATINRLLIFTRPAHLQKVTGRELDERARDVARADYLRKALAAARPAGGPEESK